MLISNTVKIYKFNGTAIAEPYFENTFTNNLKLNLQATGSSWWRHFRCSSHGTNAYYAATFRCYESHSLPEYTLVGDGHQTRNNRCHTISTSSTTWATVLLNMPTTIFLWVNFRLTENLWKHSRIITVLVRKLLTDRPSSSVCITL